jgi:hypothetical protein
MALRLLIDTKGDRQVDAFLAQWVQQRIPRCLPFGDPTTARYRAIGIIRGENLVAAAVYTDLMLFPGGGGNVYISFAADAPVVQQGAQRTRRAQGLGAAHWATWQAVNFILGIPFEQFGVTRITALIDRSFTASRKLVTDVGFKQEGVARQILPQSRDAVIYGLLKTEFLGGRFGPKSVPAAPAIPQAA